MSIWSDALIPAAVYVLCGRIHWLVHLWDASHIAHEDCSQLHVLLHPEQYPNRFNLNKPYMFIKYLGTGFIQVIQNKEITRLSKTQ
jgi:hypothetical protein